jgi:hypothetical protein
MADQRQSRIDPELTFGESEGHFLTRAGQEGSVIFSVGGPFRGGEMPKDVVRVRAARAGAAPAARGLGKPERRTPCFALFCCC